MKRLLPDSLDASKSKTIMKDPKKKRRRKRECGNQSDMNLDASNSKTIMKDNREAIRNQSDAMLNFTKHLLSKEDKNVVISPLSIQLMLSLIASGSKGYTLDQLLSFLNSKSIDHLNSFASQLAVAVADASRSGGPRLSFANGVWLDKSVSLKPSFKQLVDSQYKAVLAQVNFKTKAAQVTQQVNSWVEKETSGLIKQILSAGSVKRDTRLVLANALYFKGAWEDEFNKSKTKDYDFHLTSGSSVKVPFITCYKRQFIRVCDGFKVLGLPYKQGKDNRHFSMYFFLPDSNDGLSALVEKMGSESGFLENHLPKSAVRVGDFRIPRFKISYGVEASNVLKELGVTLPFSGGELTEMVDSADDDGEKLYVSSIFHKAFIEVNEEGTEATAVSVGYYEVLGGWSRSMPATIDFVADHPFFFVVKEDMTGTLLFIGQVLNPLAG